MVGVAGPLAFARGGIRFRIRSREGDTFASAPKPPWWAFGCGNIKSIQGNAQGQRRQPDHHIPFDKNEVASVYRLSTIGFPWTEVIPALGLGRSA